MPYDDDLNREFAEDEEWLVLHLPHCAHCNSNAAVEILGERSTVRMEHWDVWQKDYFGRETRAYYCKACDDVTLVRVINNYSQESPSVLYPRKFSLDVPAPPPVASAARGVERALGANPRECALAVRRLLEAVCEDQGSRSGSLRNRIDSLGNEGVLPQRMVDMCHLLRNIGNMAAHHGERGDRIDEGHARVLYGSTRLMLEAIYGIEVSIGRLGATIASLGSGAKENVCDDDNTV